MAEPLIRFQQARGEPGPCGRLILDFEVHNPGGSPLYFLDVRGTLCLVGPPDPQHIMAEGTFIGELTLEHRSSTLYPLEPGARRTWGLAIVFPHPVLEFMEKVRRRGTADIYLRAMIEVLVDQGPDRVPRLQWTRVVDHEDQSRSYARARVAESDWLKLVSALRAREASLGRALGRAVAGEVISNALRGVWNFLRGIPGWISRTLGGG